MVIPQSVFVAGHTGMVGQSLVRAFSALDTEVLLASRQTLDLRDQPAVFEFLADHTPEVVIVAAARVGGIVANNTMPAAFIYDNLAIAMNLIHGAHRAGINRLLFLGSSCAYPRLADQPIRESSLLSGALEPTNEPYAIAKIAGVKLCESYNRQYGRDYRSLMPTNLYGPGDNFHPTHAHVLPALLRRFHEAKRAGSTSVTVWGSGNARREFMHVDDLADACLFTLGLPEAHVKEHLDPQQSQINVGTGAEISIADLALKIAHCVGFEGDVQFDPAKPDGAPRKRLDVSLLDRLGWQAKISFEAGLTETYRWFVDHEAELRAV